MIYTIFDFLNSLLVKSVHAQSNLEEKMGRVTGGGGGGTGEGAFAGFVQAILELAVPLGVFIAFVLLGFAAFAMITSAGDPEKLKNAKEIATNAIIGVVMIALGVIILSLLGRELGIPGA